MAKSFSKKQAPETLLDHRRALDAVLDDVGASPRVVVVFGEEAYLRTDAVSRVLAALEAAYPGIDRVVLRGGGGESGGGLSWGGMLGELAGASLFASRKVVVVREGHRLFFPGGAGADEDDTDDDPSPLSDDGAEGDPRAGPDRFARRLAEGLPPDMWLVVETATLPKNRGVGSALRTHGRLIPCPVTAREALVAEWMRERATATGHALTPGAAQWLLQAHGPNLGVLAGEIDKLSTYLDGREGAPIDEETVSVFFAGTEEFHAFALTNAVENRDAGEALRILRIVTEQGARDAGGKRRDADASARMMLGRLPSTLLGLLAGCMAKRLGGGVDAVRTWTQSAPFRAEMLYRGGSRYGMGELRRAVERLAEETRAANDTGGDACLALERVVVGLLGRDLEEGDG